MICPDWWRNGKRSATHILWPYPVFHSDYDSFLLQLHHALFAGTILVYSQGMSLLAAASQRYQYELNLAEVARIWRGGCIIRSAFLEDIRAAFQASPGLPSLLLDSPIAHKLTEHQEALRQVVMPVRCTGHNDARINGFTGLF